MVEFVEANPGSGGSKFATDNDGVQDWPYTKLVWGAHDTQTIVAAGASALPIQDGGNSITVDGTVSVGLTTADLDTGAGTDTRAVVGLVLAANAGGVLVGAANPMPVSDNGSTISVDDAGGSLTVDGTVTVQDGGGAISIDDNGGSITVDGTVAVSGTVTVDTELPAAVTLADNLSNPTTPLAGACMMVMNGSAQWTRVTTGAVDGTGSTNKMPSVTYTFNGTTYDRARTLGIGDGAAATGIAAVGGMLFNGTNYDIPRGDATNGAWVNVKTIVANVTVDLNRLAGTATAVNAGNVSNGTLRTVLATDQPTLTNLIGTVVAPQQTGALYSGTTALTPKFAFANVAASSTDSAVVAAVASKKIRVLDYKLMAGATATDATFNTKPAGAGTAISMKHACGANGGIAPGYNPLGHFETAVGEGLALTTGAGSTVGVQITYVEA